MKKKELSKEELNHVFTIFFIFKAFSLTCLTALLAAM